MYCLMYDPVFFYQGGDNADSYKRICLLPLANLYFVPVHSGPSMCPSSVDWDNFKFTFFKNVTKTNSKGMLY